VASLGLIGPKPGPHEPPDQPPAPRPAASLLRNTVAQAGPATFGYVLSFASAPIVLTGLGLRMFGIWALTGALAQYGGLLDFGIGRSLARFVAAHEHDRRACGEYMVIGLSAMVVLLAVLAVVAVAVAPVLADTLGHISTADMRVALVSSVVLLVSTLTGIVIAGYPVGLRRMVAPNIGMALGAAINFCASVGAIAAGAGLPGYAVANAVAGVVSVGVVIIVVVRAEGAIPLAVPSRTRTTEFLRFGVKLQLAWAMELINYQSDKIVIALSVGPSVAGAYELANRVAAAARQLGILPSTALLPSLTARFVASGAEELRRDYEVFTERIVSIAFPALVLAGALSPMLFEAWLGHIPPHAAVVLPALVIPYLATVSSDLTKVVASASGDPTLVARIAVATALVNLAITASLAPVFGLWGVLVGTVVALTVGALVQVAMVQRRFALPAGAYARAVLPSLRLCVALAAPVAALSYSGVIHGRALQAVTVVALSVVYALVYLALSVRADRVPHRLLDYVPGLRRFQVAG
jgi:O-antigen/teichoic acid export membrane protein